MESFKSEVVEMRQLIAIGTSDRNRYFVVRFPGIPECMAFAESLEAVRAATARGRARRNEATRWTNEVIFEPSTFNIGPHARSLQAKSRRRGRRLTRLAPRST
jgi:hypothetical protein